VVKYATSKPADPVALLQERLDRGELTLRYDERWGYLPAVLDELKIPVSSQSLVFSKTSLQLLMISPQTPRAVYFNDDVYIGGVKGSPLMEVASVDPKLGTVFYTLSQDETEKPRFEREFFACLLCHDSAATAGVPGLTMLSVLPDDDGKAIAAAGTVAMNDRTPFKERFGGWYVTGTHGDQRHWGNMTLPLTRDSIRDPQAFIARLNLNPGANVTSLEKRFDAKYYLSEHSDIVALMVLTHQTRVHNLITRAQYDVLEALREDADYAQFTPRTETGYSEVTNGKIRSAVEPLLRVMLFVWEAELTAPISGTSTFAADFMKRGPHDAAGRSLRDLDLTKRLFKYPLSYLIYSDAFNALPKPAKDQFYRRLREVLSGTDQGRDFSHLSGADRSAILAILSETKPEF
jgi:hypothetical protein